MLIDINHREIKVGDTYKTIYGETIFRVFYKNGALCGGKTFENCEPLGWEVSDPEDGSMGPADTSTWLEII